MDGSATRSLAPGASGPPKITLRLEDNFRAEFCFPEEERAQAARWYKEHPPGTPAIIEGYYAYGAVGVVQFWYSRVHPNGFR